jgi:hypothetical protein
MKKLILVAVLVSFVIYGASVLACDCDTAMAITHGMQDRLHQPWPGDPERSERPESKVKSNEVGVAGPRQETGPMNMNQNAKPPGEIKR